MGRVAPEGSPGVGLWQGQTNPAGWAGTGWAWSRPRPPPMQDACDLIPGLEDQPGAVDRGSVICRHLPWGQATGLLSNSLPRPSVELRMWPPSCGVTLTPAGNERA